MLSNHDPAIACPTPWGSHPELASWGSGGVWPPDEMAPRPSSAPTAQATSHHFEYLHPTGDRNPPKPRESQWLGRSERRSNAAPRQLCVKADLMSEDCFAPACINENRDV
ncbi:hypothetical protein AAFF_G00286700 [Aldrovandia affinis]|uniref:Uncharacterized protein n=1 Tax=Aldrovandia affinis TaxID=143900 RepID=A0AAD7TB04_9TELE|nr:hypothetical protein AAFF_G00286700 [Aldrovandia affinis]